jgi:hypothetical protein
LSERSDWRLRSILFKTELTSPALCALATAGDVNVIAPTSSVNNKARGTNLFINAPK